MPVVPEAPHLPTDGQTDHGAATKDKEATNQDVYQRGDPEGEEIEGLVTVVWGLWIDIVGLVFWVDPHITSDKPAE